MLKVFAALRTLPHKLVHIYGFTRESLKDVQRDYTRGSLHTALMLLAIPMVLEMAMESLFAVVDIYFVSFLGADAVATVGITEAAITLLYAIAIGLSMAATAMIARRIGARDTPAAIRAAAQVLWLGMLVALLIGAIGFFYAEAILTLMGASESVVSAGSSYTQILLSGSGTVLFIFLINAIFRGAGDATIAMRSLWLANGINIILDPCFIFGLGPFPELGVTGAAVATTLGRGIAVLYQIHQLSSGRSRIHIGWQQLAIHWQDMLQMLRISFGGIMQFFIATSSWIALMWIIADFGSKAVAGYTIGIRLIVFTILPAWGLGNAAATLVGQNLGNKDPDRAEQSVWLAVKLNAIFLAAVSIIFIAFAPQLIGLFSQDQEVLMYGISCLRYISYGYVLYAVGMIMIHAFNGAGDTGTPTYVYFFSHWLLQLPLAYGLAHHARLGPDGVFIATLVAESMLTLIVVLLFRRGHWKLRKI